MGHDARSVTNFILDLCEQNGRTITNLSLQKILYFCHVWSLIDLKRPLIKHQFEAWKYGPVIQYIYQEFKEFDNLPISSRATEIDRENGKRRIVPYRFDKETEENIRRSVEFYSRLTANDLVKLSHAQGSPWHKVWHHEGAANPGMKISDEMTRIFYSRVRPPFSLQ